MEAMTVTNEKTLQQGLNDVVINKVQRMIDGKAVGVQATMERLISEGKIAQDYIAPVSYTHLDVYKRQRICRTL